MREVKSQQHPNVKNNEAKPKRKYCTGTFYLHEVPTTMNAGVGFPLLVENGLLCWKFYP